MLILVDVHFFSGFIKLNDGDLLLYVKKKQQQQ